MEVLEQVSIYRRYWNGCGCSVPNRNNNNLITLPPPPPPPPLLLLLLSQSLITGFLSAGASPLEPVVHPTTQASSYTL
jgi:hypothetical protein